jgi:sialic acid synthase SpsE
MGGLTTLALIGVGISAVAAGAGTYAAIKQGNAADDAASYQASQAEIKSKANELTRSQEQFDEANQKLERARQLDTLFREQRVMSASSGLNGESFSAMQARDLSAYSREINNMNTFSSAKDANAAVELSQMKSQIAQIRSAGAFARRAGLLNAGIGLLSATGSGFSSYATIKGKLNTKS